MPRYWVIAPVEAHPSEMFEKVWKDDLENDSISIGWRKLGDVTSLTNPELSALVDESYPEKTQGARTSIVRMIWSFFHEIQPGDIVIARRGTKVIAGVGKVLGKAVHRESNVSGHTHANWLPVEWQEEPRDLRFDDVKFSMMTLNETQESRYLELVGKVISLASTAEKPEDMARFFLEKYLEDFIVDNFDSIFHKELRIFEVEETGTFGQQFLTKVGPIDILAIDLKTQDFVVLELKKGRSCDQVVGQILRYMGWIKLNLCKEGQAVRGLIICSDEDPKLRYALEMTKDIGVRFYSISFKLSEKPWQ